MPVPVQPLFQMMFQSAAIRAAKANNPIVSSKITPYSVREAWLSDSATYPLITCLFGAGAFIVGFTLNTLTRNKDVRINPGIKHQVIRDWGKVHSTTIAEAVGKRPLFNAQRYKTLPYEGLGVDHKEWQKQHDAGSHN